MDGCDRKFEYLDSFKRWADVVDKKKAPFPPYQQCMVDLKNEFNNADNQEILCITNIILMAQAEASRNIDIEERMDELLSLCTVKNHKVEVGRGAFMDEKRRRVSDKGKLPF